MAEHFDLVVSRFKNMLARITAADPTFEELCKKHADLTTQIRSLPSDVDPTQSQRARDLRRSRAALEEQMFAIMQANTRV